MRNNEERNEFLSNLFSNAFVKYKATKEYGYRHQREEQIDGFLSTNLTMDEKHFIGEIRFELGTAAERKAGVVYQQGLKDCVWLLKNLGVPA